MDFWAATLQRHRTYLDLSSIDLLDGSPAPAVRGGKAVEYQGRKRRKTTNALYLTDRQGIPLAMSEPVAGNHNDLYDIEVQFEVVTAALETSEISLGGLFLNADAGFDSKEFRSARAKKEVNANICFNKRNGNADRDQYFDGDLTVNGMQSKGRTLGWTVFAHCPTGSIPPLPVGKGSTTCHLWCWP